MVCSIVLGYVRSAAAQQDYVPVINCRRDEFRLKLVCVRRVLLVKTQWTSVSKGFVDLKKEMPVLSSFVPRIQSMYSRTSVWILRD